MIDAARDAAPRVQHLKQLFKATRILTCALAIALITMLTSTVGAAWASDAMPAFTNATPDGLYLSALPPGNAIKDGKALLRYALPVDNKTIRRIQKELEDISETLRVQGSRRIKSVNRNIDRLEKLLRLSDEVLAAVPDGNKPKVEALLASLTTDAADLRVYVDEKDKEAIWIKRSEMLDIVGEIESLMVTGFPFEVPEEYNNLPQLKGRATVEIVTEKGTMQMVVDGYNAPVTAGNFVDLVQRKFYDGLEITREESFYVVQTGDPPGPDAGFIDPDTGEYRSIPLEIMVQGEKEPLYGFTMEDVGLYLDDPVLPFSAYGTVAMARPGNDPNGASSQFFFLKFESELTPAGLNLLDGRYAVFGYLVKNERVLDELRVGDRIESARVIDGLENLVPPSA
ncbi:MAG: peptidylprolyl isomerase [Leptolyngbyaceae bacterium]|nr:peptidylprolyl isomerase [Leptolyngbyaceae bacterium]